MYEIRGLEDYIQHLHGGNVPFDIDIWHYHSHVWIERAMPQFVCPNVHGDGGISCRTLIRKNTPLPWRSSGCAKKYKGKR